jgi:hypothetical protein
MAFSGSQAWQDAQQTVARNREIFLAMAGVFYLVPALLVGLVWPQPEPQPGLTPQQTIALVADFWKGALPAYVVLGLFQTVGTIALLRLCTDRTRPTVGDAIRVGLSGLLTYFGAQLVLGLGFGLIGGLLVAIGGISGSTALIAIVVIALIVVLIYVLLRTTLLAPVIAVDGERNPIAALRRSWDLTRGNTGGIFGFFLLLGLAFGVVLIVAMLIVGIVLALVAGQATAKTLATIVSTALTAGMTVYFVAALASIHRQLAGPDRQGLGETFE